MGPHTLAIYEAGIDAERDGYSAVCIDTISESGMNGLRSRLSTTGFLLYTANDQH